MSACSDPTVKRTHSAITFEPSSLDFGAQPIGTEKTLTVKLTNSGTGDLRFTKSLLVDDKRGAFHFVALPASVSSGHSIDIAITYLAQAPEGPDGAHLSIESNADNAPEAIFSLAGRSVSPCAVGFTLCGTECINEAIDDLHCGACDTTCHSPEHCRQGRCSCTPKTCADIGNCGSGEDGCGNTLNCGECTSPNECITNRCTPPTCRDQRVNGTESDLDCGGICPTCHVDQKCNSVTDCDTGLICSSGICAHCTESSQCADGRVCKAGLCGDCATRADCETGDACVTGRCRSCPGEAAFNACGLCGGPTVSGVGAPCVTGDGCSSTYACNATLDGVVCQANVANACGLCGGPAVSGIGNSCVSTSGCASVLACNPQRNGTTCVEVSRNECGLCGGPPVSGIGTNCIDSTGCISAYVCNAQNAGVTCKSVGKNECGLCGGQPVPNLGNTCASSTGCSSTLVCSSDKASAVCPDIQPNSCGVCGGPAMSGVGTSCVDAVGCASSFACNTSGTGLTCSTVGKNQCNLCGGPPVANLGQTCTSTSGCRSTLVCDSAGSGSVCKDVTRNECGVCNGATVAGIGQSCTNAAGCSGSLVCNSAGTGTNCDAPATCSIANHLVISQIAGYDTNGEYDEFIELYNPTSSTVDVSAYSVWYRSASNTTRWSLLTSLNGSVAAHGYFLTSFGGSSSTYSHPTVPADATYGGNGGNGINIAAVSGQVLLWKSGTTPPASPAGASDYVDYVGYGLAAAYEGTAAPSPGQFHAIMRKATVTSTSASMAAGGADDGLGNGVDTQSNGQDFVTETTPRPRNRASPAQP